MDKSAKYKSSDDCLWRFPPKDFDCEDASTSRCMTSTTEQNKTWNTEEEEDPIPMFLPISKPTLPLTTEEAVDEDDDIYASYDIYDDPYINEDDFDPFVLPNISKEPEPKMAIPLANSTKRKRSVDILDQDIEDDSDYEDASFVQLRPFKRFRKTTWDLYEERTKYCANAFGLAVIPEESADSLDLEQSGAQPLDNGECRLFRCLYSKTSKVKTEYKYEGRKRHRKYSGRCDLKDLLCC